MSIKLGAGDADGHFQSRHQIAGDKECESSEDLVVPADSDDIRKEYDILLNELRTFNPEMLDKQRVLAITKSDIRAGDMH